MAKESWQGLEDLEVRMADIIERAQNSGAQTEQELGNSPPSKKRRCFFGGDAKPGVLQAGGETLEAEIEQPGGEAHHEDVLAFLQVGSASDEQVNSGLPNRETKKDKDYGLLNRQEAFHLADLLYKIGVSNRTCYGAVVALGRRGVPQKVSHATAGASGRGVAKASPGVSGRTRERGRHWSHRR
ncbi:MAG: hypothetical protein CL798_07335 [Chromatiales bacterium]|nr:hypothetical protein [Chromatiales bacterium]